MICIKNQVQILEVQIKKLTELKRQRKKFLIFEFLNFFSNISFTKKTIKNINLL